MVYTNEDVFTVSGDVTSLYGNMGQKINGDLLVYPSGDLNVLAEPITQVFSYGAQLQEGENVVTVEFTDEATGASATVTFTVVKDTAAPRGPGDRPGRRRKGDPDRRRGGRDPVLQL